MAAGTHTLITLTAAPVKQFSFFFASMTINTATVSVATAATADVHLTVKTVAIVAIKPVIGICTLTPATVKQFLLV